jgi:hypothetical protein
MDQTTTNLRGQRMVAGYRLEPESLRGHVPDRRPRGQWPIRIHPDTAQEARQD